MHNEKIILEMKETCEKVIADKIESSTISDLTDLIANQKRTALEDVCVCYFFYFDIILI